MMESRAHPRSRGEHTTATSGNRGGKGSSPLTRGAPAAVHPSQPAPGLIPAHAGSTMRTSTVSPTRWAHPRSRGEHTLPAVTAPRTLGSSPLTRGARHNPYLGRGWIGLIPAHAGSTSRALCCCGGVWAHPRSRGEHPGGVSETTPPDGSSPLTRGAPGRTRTSLLL